MSLPTTRTVEEYTDEWRIQTPRDQLGFPKTHGELREKLHRNGTESKEGLTTQHECVCLQGR
jgi:hypothetical protein